MGSDLSTFRVSHLIAQSALLINDGYRARNDELSSLGLPFARAGNVSGAFHFDGADCFPECEISRVGNKVSQAGDVVFTSKGTVGRFAYVSQSTPRFVYSPQLCFWRALDYKRINSRWLYYWMQSAAFGDQCNAVKGQTDMADYVSLRDQRMMYITLPDISQQNAVGEVLGAIDAKIEVNRGIADGLESLAHETYKSWFVECDPVAAKARGTAPFGLSPSIASLFPATFNLGGTQPVPSGWEMRQVRECVHAVYDGPHATPPPSDRGPIFLGIGNMTGSRIDLTDVRHINEEHWSHWTKRVTPSAGDVVFTYEATVGNFAIIPKGMRCCLGRRLALIRPLANRHYPHYLLHTFLADPFQTLLLTRLNQGSTVLRTPLTDFPKYEMLWPGDSLAKAFEDIAQPIWEAIHGREAESQTLAALRDTLLPKLMSGELRIRDAEKIVGTHV